MAERVFLVGDPDPGQRQLVDLLLADEGAEMIGVSTARAMLEYLRERTPTLIVISEELPDLEGTAVASRVKAVARLAHVPIILTTETGGQGLTLAFRERASSAGVDLVLPKPLGDKNFRDRARRLMSASVKVSSQHGGGSTQVIEETIRDLGRGIHLGGGARSSGGVSTVGGGPSEPDAHSANGEAQPQQQGLRVENDRLKREVAELRMQLDRMRTELSELKRPPQRRRGPFGRRRDG